MNKEEKKALKAEKKMNKKAAKASKKLEKPTIKEVFSSRASKAGGFSLAIIAVVIAIVVAVNILVGVVPSKYTSFDLTENKTATIGETTQQILSKLTDKITINYICQNGNEDQKVSALIDSYAQASKNITVKRVDPVVSPSFAKQYTKDEVGDNTVIVVCGDKSKVLTSEDLYEYTMDYSSYQYQQTAFCAENAITNAIDFVTDGNTPVISFLTGHGEDDLDESFESAFIKSNYSVNTISLLTSKEIPEETSTVGILAPKKDYSAAETATLKSYVENGGKMFIATNLITKEEFPNIYAFLEGYGIKLVDGYILEKDANMYLSSYYSSNQFYLLPNKADHEITAQFANYYLLFPSTQGFEISEDLPEGVSVDSLLTSSDKAFATTDYETRESADFKDGDIKPESVFSVGAVIHVNSGDEGENSGVIVYYSCSTFINSQINSYVGGTNSALAVSSMSYLNGKKASVNIPSKSLEMQPLSFTAQQVNLFTIIFILVIPIAVLVTGIVVWARRRKR